ncbi:MAG TPA: dihydroorotate dehydrogenase-like protein [Candidatus Dormibacteraeota bacterium]|nr:dihydroorotate dehydrogenase-like protein [Candidatus Dormibacteraeota bacterium]
MIELGSTYLGIVLKNPVVVSASPLQKELDNIRRMEDAGAGAIVMHSLFEEQIRLEGRELNRWLEQGTESYAESLRYLPDMENYNLGPEGYLEHLARAKNTVHIPIIGSLNGISRGGWTHYAHMMEQAGADAIELNLYEVPTDPNATGDEIEQRYCDLVAHVRGSVHVPLAVKIGASFSSMSNMARKLDQAGANGLVLFNRFYQPDFDLEALEVVPTLNLSRSEELLPRLSWVAILYGHIRSDMAVTGGVHAGSDVLKCMMAGARVAMMTSALLHNGIGHIAQVLAQMQSWMEEHEYESIRQMQGSMARRSVPDPAAYERGNYMQVLSSYALKGSR